MPLPSRAPDRDVLTALYPALGRLPVALGERLRAGLRQVALPAQVTVFDAGTPCAGFPLVLEGSIRVVKAAPNGRELPLYRVGPGESCILTSGCLLGGLDYDARGVTEAPTTLAILPRPLFREMIATSEAFRDEIFRLIGARMSELMQLVAAVAFQRLDQRLAGALLGHGPVIATTHQALADELGSVREIVTRLLRGFADQGLVALGRERIEIRDAAGLRAIATGQPPGGAR